MLADIDDLLVESFAVIREAADRVLGQRHFDVQLIGGMVLHDGNIAEMRTGEGKTLMSTLPAYLNAISGDGVHRKIASIQVGGPIVSLATRKIDVESSTGLF